MKKTCCLLVFLFQLWQGLRGEEKKDFFIFFVAEYGLRAEQVISNTSRTLKKKILKPFIPQKLTECGGRKPLRIVCLYGNYAR